MRSTPKPIVLMILDGWGHRDATQHNPVQTVKTPTFDRLYEKYPHTLLDASGPAVGLPEGQMGNSEVGHLHLGSGRKVPQDLTRIDLDISTGDFYQNPVLHNAINTAKEKDKAIHILGLVSPGGVHSHESHIIALMDMIAEHGIEKSYLHAILDGRDTPPQSALASLEKCTQHYASLPGGKVASIVGRYYAMDRDKRWERTQQAYDLLTTGKVEHHANTAMLALNDAYARKETDEFVKPTAIYAEGESATIIEDGDVVIFMNFRADRARQLCFALTDSAFDGFHRATFPNIADFVTLTAYDEKLFVDVAYPKPVLNNTLGEFLSSHGKTQLRLAETEKYAHVTYFFNGGHEQPFPKEDRTLIPSPKVATYDLQPEMSAAALTTALVDAIQSREFDVIICNYANPDMVGHTGVETAANQAVSVIDTCIDQVLNALQSAGGELLITADHGNIETMYNPDTGQPHTAHTRNPVPLIYVGRPAHFTETLGALDDVAPTMLRVMGLTPPEEMTGKNLLALD